MIAIRAATRADVTTILRFVRDLAAFEREPDAVEATKATLAEALFGEHPAAEAVIAELDGMSAGSLCSFTISRPGPANAGSIWKIST